MLLKGAAKAAAARLQTAAEFMRALEQPERAPVGAVSAEEAVNTASAAKTAGAIQTVVLSESKKRNLAGD